MRSPFHAPAAAGLRGRSRPQPNALRVVANWMARHRSRQVLSKLDRHMLRDIGLTEQDLVQELSKPFWRD